MQVNEKRLDQLIDTVGCPDDDELIDNCNDKCSECWKKFLTEQPPAPTETPAMIKLVSDQLFNARNACK